MAREMELLLSRLQQTTGHAPRRSGQQWSAHCPAHDDRRASLSLSDGAEGRVLLHCHAGCAPEAICRALALDISILMPEHQRMPNKQRRVGEMPGQASEAQPVGNLCEAPPHAPATRGVCCTPNWTSPVYPSRDDAWRYATSIRGEPSHAWEYHNAAGECVGIVLRWDKPEGKTIRPLARVDGGWIIGAMPAPRPLYCLPEINQQLAPRSDSFAPPVNIVEGEKAADAGRSLGLLCTTSSGGSAAAHQTDWSPLAGCDIVLLPDNDEAGRKYAAAVCRELLRLRPLPHIRQVRLPHLPKGGDLADFVAVRTADPCGSQSPDPAPTPAEIVQEIESLSDQVSPVAPAQSYEETTMAPRPTLSQPSSAPLASQLPLAEPILTRLDQCHASPLRWLWPGRVPIGKLTLLIGDPGLGKSFITLDVAARISRGLDLPAFEGEPSPVGPAAPGSVVLLSAEDDVSDTIRPRLAAAGADLARIVALDAVRTVDSAGSASHESTFSLACDLDVLERVVRSLDNCRLVVIDPITAYLGRSDSHKNAEMRALLAPLSELAARTGVAVLAVNHLNKMGQGPAIYRSMGSLAFAATARSVLAVLADPYQPEARLLVSLKSNVAAAVAGLGFRVATSEAAIDSDMPMPVVRWNQQPVHMTAEEIMHATAQASATGPAIDEAVEWLRTVLASGPHAAVQLKEKAKADGIRERTLIRAKTRLGVQSLRDGFGLNGTWLWRLPNP